MTTAPLTGEYPHCYRGRFAPSPTGPLHLGSLYSAVTGWLHARHHRGQWLLRLEDIDPPREAAGARDAILRGLEAHGLSWDGELMYQFPRMPLYRDVALQLLAQGLAYYCTCSRQQLREHHGHHQDHCIGRTERPVAPAAIRFHTRCGDTKFEDLVLGSQSFSARQVGDFVIWRKDDLPAYQLAVVVDDIGQQISHVVRGRDLLESTPGQIQLYQALGAAPPAWLHHPVLGHDGHKLSKQAGARPVNCQRPQRNLLTVLRLLGLKPETALESAEPAEMLGWAAGESWPDLAGLPAMINPYS